MSFPLLFLVVGYAVAVNPPPPKYEVPENFTIPPVLYVPTSVLAIYGLTGSYGPEPPTRPTMEHLTSLGEDEATLKKFSEKLGNDTETLTLGQLAKAAWSVLDDTTANYFQWLAAHALNAVFAAQTIRRPADAAALEAFYIAMGHCKCPQNPSLGVTFPKVCESKAKGEADCVVTREEAHRAQEVVENLSSLNRYWIRTLSCLSTDKCTLFDIKPGKLVANIGHSQSLSDDYANIMMSYNYLVVREAAAISNMTVEAFLDSRQTEKVVWPTSNFAAEETSENDEDDDDE